MIEVEAVAAAAELLRGAKLPLVTGLAECTVEAQRRAVEIADRIGGVIDPLPGVSHDAFQRYGRVMATLGEIRERARLLVFWGVDPERIHPGFAVRYLVPAAGREPPFRIAVDVGDARGPAEADRRIEVDPAREIEALWALRARLRGRRVDPVAGVATEGVRVLRTRLAESGYSVVFHDPLGASDHDVLRATALAALSGEANDRAPTRLVGVRPPDNRVGAENVLTWQSGFPGAVSFSRGYPRFGPGEWDAETLLSRGEADAVLLVGARPDRHLSPAALAHLRAVPVVMIGPVDALASFPSARVAIPAAAWERTPGSVYRMDGIALRRRVEAPTDLPTEEAVLTQLSGALQRSPAGGAA